MRQTILVILLILLLAAAGLVWFSYRPSRPAAPSPAAARSPELARYQELQRLAPDLALFGTPAFKALRGISSPPEAPPTAGARQNPFNPLQ